MSYQSGSLCFATSAEAVAATLAGQIGSTVVFSSVEMSCNAKGKKCVPVTSTEPYLLSGTSSGNVITYNYTGFSSGNVVTNTVTLNPLPCTLLDTSDGLSIAWAVVACWVAAYAISLIRRVL